MSTVQKSAPSGSGVAPHRSWLARHKFLTALGVLVVLLVVAFFVWGWPLVQWRFHSLFAKSLDEIRSSPAAIERLGEPIKVPLLPLPAGRVHSDNNSGEARFDFTVVGPKDKADVESQMRMVNGEWGFAALKLKFSDKVIDLAQAIQQRDGNGLPPFDPYAKQPEIKQPDLPRDISLPKDLPSQPQK